MDRGRRSWVLAHCLLFGAASAIESSSGCALVTTTVYLPTTIYTFAPSITNGDAGGSCTGTSSFTVTIETSTSSTTQTTTEVTSAPTSTTPISASSSDISTTISSTSLTSISTIHTSLSSSSITTGISTPTTTGYPTPTSIGGLPPPPPPPPPPGPFKGFKNSIYFTNWGIAQERYIPQRLPVDDLSHVMYAFADILPNGTVTSANPLADLEQKYEDDKHWEPGRNAYGAVKQLYIHKKWNRQLKVLLSVGGGEFSPKFANATATDARRLTFANSAVKLVTDWGFDGVDIDWEYPTNEVERDSLVKLVAACREAFDRYSFHNGLRYRFLVTVASPAGPTNWKFVDLPAMDRYIDIWHLMSYDYAGSWTPRSGHQTNVFANKANEAATPLNTNDAIQYYNAQGISGRKIVIGLPLFGRSFNGTSGLGQNYTSVGSGGPQPGVWYYKDLPKPGAREEFDDAAKATYSYDRKKRELVTYDDVRSTSFKARYIDHRRLGGAFFWEASGDRTGRGSLVKTMSRALDWLERTPNNLRYPTSQYMNIPVRDAGRIK